MRENISKQTDTVRRSAKKGRSVPQVEQLPNSVMLGMRNGTDSISVDVQDRMDSLKSSILSRMPVIPPHPQDQIPLAESEAERLSSNVYGSTPDAVKSAMGNKLRADFSAVRFHTDADSAAKADAMGARAFTAGNDIYFGSGGIEANAAAHELVHTVQQGAVDGAGVSVSVPLGGVQMLPNPWKWLKRKFKGQTEEEQENEEQENARHENIRAEREKEDKTERDNHSAPFGAKANERGGGILGSLKRGASWLGNKIMSPFRALADDHRKSLDDLNLNRGAYNKLGTWDKFKDIISNPLAHLRSGSGTMQDSVKRHMQDKPLNQIKAYGIQREKGTSKYSNKKVVDLKHVDLDAIEEKRRQTMRQQYLDEKAGKGEGSAPDAVSDVRSPLALNHVPRPDMSNPGKGPIDNSSFLVDSAKAFTGIADGERALEQGNQGDFAGSLGHSLDAGSQALSAVDSVVGVPGLNIASSGLNTASGMVQGVRGTMTASNLDNTLDNLHGKQLDPEQQRLAKSANQMRGQATVDQTAGYTKGLSGALNTAGNIASLTGAGAPIGLALKGAASVTKLIGGSLTDSALEDVQHTVVNQEVNLDQDVNERLKNNYTEEQWSGMSDEEREKATKEEEKVMMYFHGDKHGDKEHFVVKESQKRAEGLVQSADSDNKGTKGLTEEILTGTGLSRRQDGKYDEKAVGRKLYSRDGKDLNEIENDIDLKHTSRFLPMLRKKQEDEAKPRKWWDIF